MLRTITVVSKPMPVRKPAHSRATSEQHHIEDYSTSTWRVAPDVGPEHIKTDTRVQKERSLYTFHPGLPNNGYIIGLRLKTYLRGLHPEFKTKGYSEILFETGLVPGLFLY